MNFIICSCVRACRSASISHQPKHIIYKFKLNWHRNKTKAKQTKTRWKIAKELPDSALSRNDTICGPSAVNGWPILRRIWLCNYEQIYSIEFSCVACVRMALDIDIDENTVKLKMPLSGRLESFTKKCFTIDKWTHRDTFNVWCGGK